MIKNENNFEDNLSDILKESIRMYVDMIERLARGEEYLIWDCIVCNLEADINFAEARGEITYDQAWYLREKYLGEKDWRKSDNA